MKTIMKIERTHKVVLNHSKKTLTIKAYEDGKIYATYKEDDITPELAEQADNWTENDIRDYLKTSGSYYKVNN